MILDFFTNFLQVIKNVFDRIMNIQIDGINIFAAFAAFGIIVYAFCWIMDIIEGD